MLPHTLDFTPAKPNRENLEKLNALGLEMEEFGSETPISCEASLTISTLKGILMNKISVNWLTTFIKLPLPKRVALTLSCKGAIKAGKHLSNAEIRALLEQLAETENPYTCPHGRPIIVRLDDNEILKRFGR